uniref:Paired box 4 n=1 Tax=Gadus morhua TaxID=8049 RepID=A0A8C5F9X5_GADMO
MDSAMTGGGSVNQLGGTFLNGRPLAHPMRRRIIDLATQGVRPSEISKMIRVSNGCVSKILSRFHKTGLLDPKAMGGSRPRLLTSEVVDGIIQCKRKNPTIFGWEIRRKLATQSVCKPSQVPSVSSINRFLRKLHLDRGPMFLETNGTHPDSTLDEACEQEACSDDWKRKDSLIQNRTIYTPRQSNALEQGLFYCILCLIILFCSVQFHSISIHSILINAFFKYYFSVNCSVLSESICRYVHKGETISENTPSRG